MTKHDIDVARMRRFVLRGFKFEFTGFFSYCGELLKTYRLIYPNGDTDASRLYVSFGYPERKIA